jgi:uncharacterized protein YjbI with pentapeptide repeats
MSRLIKSLIALSFTALAALVARTDAIYWTDRATDGSRAIMRADLDTFEAVPVIPQGLPGAVRIAIDELDAKMYWTTGQTVTGSEVYRANLDGSDVEAIATFGGYVGTIGIAIDRVNARVYWSRGNDVWRANLDGSDLELTLHINELTVVQDVALDLANLKLYVSNWSGWEIDRGKIQRANLDGTQLEDVITNIGNGPVGVAVDAQAGRVYWTKNASDSNRGCIMRADLDGTDPETVIAQIDPEALLLDLEDDRAYWTTFDYENPNGVIQRCNLDGSGLETLPVGAVFPGGAAILRGDEPPCPGDLDGDGDVDLSDLSALLAVYGTTCP